MNRISVLIYRYIAGTLTADERVELDRWLADSAENREFFSRVTDSADLHHWYELKRMVNSDRAAEEMMMRIARMDRPARWRRRLTAAACVAAIVAVAAGIIYRPSLLQLEEIPVAQTKALTAKDIRHGMIKATLTNAEGKQICLSDTTIHSATNLAMSIQSKHKETDVVQAEVKEMCLEVPRGGEFKIMLEDSTVVWLNADTRLFYPETFAAGERRVKISGEAYFEVRNDPSRPFYVESEGQEVRVYGTRFNIRAYADDSATYTTLESGSIAITPGRESSSEMFMRPGSQAILDRRDVSLEIKSVNSDIVTSWRNGYFVFENQTLLNIMRDLSRWYNFDFEIESEELENEIFMGSFPRDTDFPTAITILQNCGEIAFAVTGGKVIVTKAP